MRFFRFFLYDLAFQCMCFVASVLYCNLQCPVELMTAYVAFVKYSFLSRQSVGFAVFVANALIA